MSLAIHWRREKEGTDPMRYLDDVFRYAMARLGQREEAEDIAIEVVHAMPNPCYRRDLRLYMIGAARRKVADRLRNPRWQDRPGREFQESPAPGLPTFGESSHEAILVGESLEKLSQEHREVLVLKYVIGLTSAEIAKAIGKQPPAVDSMLQRARDAFAKAWESPSSHEEKP